MKDKIEVENKEREIADKNKKDNLEKCLRCEEVEELLKLSKEELCKALIENYRPLSFSFDRHFQS